MFLDGALKRKRERAKDRMPRLCFFRDSWTMRPHWWHIHWWTRYCDVVYYNCDFEKITRCRWRNCFASSGNTLSAPRREERIRG